MAMDTDTELSINCTQRAATEKPRALRREGFVPAVLYGHNGIESISLKMNTRELGALLRKNKGKKAPITVNVPELSWTGKAILQEVQTHPWKNEVYHVSFFAPKEIQPESAS